MLKKFENFNDWDIQEEEDISLKEHIYDYGWVKVYKEDWDDFVKYLKSININIWANEDPIYRYSFNDLKKKDSDLFVYIKLYQNENKAKLDPSTYAITYHTKKSYSSINNYIIFNNNLLTLLYNDINENFDFEEDWEEDPEYIIPNNLIDYQILYDNDKQCISIAKLLKEELEYEIYNYYQIINNTANDQWNCFRYSSSEYWVRGKKDGVFGEKKIHYNDIFK